MSTKGLLWRILMKNAAVSTGFARKLFPPPPPPPVSEGDERVQSWIEARGDRTYRVDYDLVESSLVWDVGGYEGDWTASIYARYRCQIEVFEPVAAFAHRIAERFAQNPAITVHAFGLGGRPRHETITLERDASSTYTSGERLETIELVDVADRVQRMSGETIDLMKINIEGGEYELLERLIATGDIARFRNIQVQFHQFVHDAEPRMRSIQDALERTHRRTYFFPWVWEGWARVEG